jgi:hypothetical protein
MSEFDFGRGDDGSAGGIPFKSKDSGQISGRFCQFQILKISLSLRHERC